MTKRLYQRGYNLVELAIILTVSLMMASWLAVNYYETQRNERINETEAQIESIKKAIVIYAAQNSARPYTLVNLFPAPTFLSTGFGRWQIPAGRPYLPCPDITGDGLEDRIAITVAAPGQIDIDETDDKGVCYRSKGVVPWRTLGTPETDLWGNRWTYRVDKSFSNANLGFDQETRADNYSYASILTDGTILPAPDFVPGATRETGGNLAYSPTAGTGLNSTLWVGNIGSIDSSSLICQIAPCSSDALGQAVGVMSGTLTLSVVVAAVAGEVTETAATLRTGGYKLADGAYQRYAANEIVNGLPIVVLSHGANGYGAVRGDPNGGVRCNPFPIPPGTPGHEDERQNAFWLQLMGSSSPCPEVSPSDSAADANGFVAHPPVYSPPLEEFDDVVGWMSAEELADALHDLNVFPVELLPPVGFEDQ